MSRVHARLVQAQHLAHACTAVAPLRAIEGNAAVVPAGIAAQRTTAAGRP